MKRKLLLLVAITITSICGGGSSAFAQENIIKDWDGGTDTGEPTSFGWASSNNSRKWGVLNGTEARFTDSYSGYKINNGSSYNYSADSELSSRILWIRYNQTTNEYYTYTFTGLKPGHTYRFSGLVGHHNNEKDPKFTISVGDETGEKTFESIEKSISVKTTLFYVYFDFTVPEDDKSEKFVLRFDGTYTKTNYDDCMEALSALSIVEYCTPVNELLAEAKSVPGTHESLKTAIADAEKAFKDGTVAENKVSLQSALETAISTARAANKAEAMAKEGTATNPADWTGAIVNPSFEEYESYVTKTAGDYQLVPAGWKESQVWTDTSWMYSGKSNERVKNGNGKYTYKVRFNWAKDTYTISQTLKDMPEGKYVISADVDNYNASNSVSKAQIVVNDKTKGLTTITKAQTIEEELILNEKGDIKIELVSDYTLGNGSSEGVVYWDNVKLLYYGILATDEDYTDLNDALDNAKEIDVTALSPLGFDKDEYAPYNISQFKDKYAAAQAINQSEVHTKSEITAATSALENAIEALKPNEDEVNAVFNGDFALSTPNVTSGADVDVPGWTASGTGLRQVIKDGVNGTFPGLATINSQQALFVHGDQTYKYGELDGYTMPLKANSIYKLTFKHAGWNGGNNWFNVSITDDNGNVLPQQQCGKSNLGPQSADCWNTFEILFATNEDVSNVILNMMPSGNSTFTDITLIKAESQELVFKDGEALPLYAEGTYPTVKIERTFTEDRWATAVYPFEISAEGVTIATLQSFSDEGELAFSTTGRSVANEPCLVKTNGNIVLNDVKVMAANALDVQDNDITFKGVYASTTVNGEDESVINYVLSNNIIYYVGSQPATVNPYRAYFVYTKDGENVKSRLSFSVDGEATGIDGIEVAEGANAGNGVYYNLAGQRVANPTNGIYIVNGKKVLIKK